MIILEEELNDLKEQISDVKDQLGDVKEQIGTTNSLLLDLQAALLELKSTTPAPTNNTSEAEYIIKALTMNFKNELVSFKEIFYTAQRHDNELMAQSLNENLDFIYGSMKAWTKHVASLESSNDNLYAPVQSELTRLITPTIGTLITSARKEIISENRLANERTNETLIEAIEVLHGKAINYVAEKKQSIPVNEPTETLGNSFLKIPSSNAVKPMFKFLFTITMINSIGLALLLVKSIFR